MLFPAQYGPAILFHKMWEAIIGNLKIIKVIKTQLCPPLSNHVFMLASAMFSCCVFDISINSKFYCSQAAFCRWHSSCSS